MNYVIVKGVRVNREMIMLGLNFINPLIRILGLGLRIPIINRYYHVSPDNIICVQMKLWLQLYRLIVDVSNY